MFFLLADKQGQYIAELCIGLGTSTSGADAWLLHVTSVNLLKSTSSMPNGNWSILIDMS